MKKISKFERAFNQENLRAIGISGKVNGAADATKIRVRTLMQFAIVHILLHIRDNEAIHSSLNVESVGDLVYVLPLFKDEKNDIKISFQRTNSIKFIVIYYNDLMIAYQLSHVYTEEGKPVSNDALFGDITLLNLGFELVKSKLIEMAEIVDNILNIDANEAQI